MHRISKLCANNSIVITASLAFADWPRISRDATITTAELGSRVH